MELSSSELNLTEARSLWSRNKSWPYLHIIYFLWTEVKIFKIFRKVNDLNEKKDAFMKIETGKI